MTNLPSYLTFDALDSEGWPISLMPRDKIWAKEIIAQLLTDRGSIGLTLKETHHRLFEEPDPTRTPGFIYARSNVTWEFAIAHKVLTTIETNQVWVLFDLRKEFDE